MLTSVITVYKDYSFRKVFFQQSQFALVLKLVIFYSSVKLLMLCCDKGVSVVPDTLFKVHNFLAVTLFWFSAKERKKQLTLSPWKGIIFWKCCFRALLKTHFLKSFYLIHGEYVLCVYKIHSFVWEREMSYIWCTYYLHMLKIWKS